MSDFTDNIRAKANDATDWVGDKVDDLKDKGQDVRADAREEKGKMEGKMNARMDDEDERIAEEDDRIL